MNPGKDFFGIFCNKRGFFSCISISRQKRRKVDVKDNMEIIILSPFFSPNIGGVETHLDDWILYLAQKRIDTLVVTFHPITVQASALDFEERGNVKIMRYHWMGRDLFYRLEKYPVLEFLYLTPYLFFCLLWTMWVKGGKGRIIHAHGLNGAFVGLVAKKFFGIPCLVSIHAVYDNPPDSLMARIAARVMNRLDRVLCLSDASVKQMLSYGVEEKTLGRFTYWVDQNVFKPAEKVNARQELELDNQFTVLFVGRLLPIKGIDLFLDVAGRHPEWNFIIVGTGPLENKVAEVSNLSENIHFWGKQPNERLPVFFNAVDAFVICSQYEEGFGRVIIEALSCGCPVVGTRRGGIVEALSHGGGILVEDTVEGISHALLSIQQQPPVRAKIAEIAREYFSQANGDSILKEIRSAEDIYE